MRRLLTLGLGATLLVACSRAPHRVSVAVADEPTVPSTEPATTTTTAVTTTTSTTIRRAPSTTSTVLRTQASVTSTTTAAAPDAFDSFGPGSWQAARTNHDGTVLTVFFVGGKEYDEANPCSVRYVPDVAETQTEVRVRIQAVHPRRAEPSPSRLICTSEGYFRHIDAPLAQPLAGRTVIEDQFNRPQPVFDGTTLADATWVPDGWTAGYEGSRSTPWPVWHRTWFPPGAAVTVNGTCSAQTGLGLDEGPAALATSYQRPDDTLEDVHGNTARYGVKPDGTTTLAWQENGQGLVVSTIFRCPGNTVTPKETVLQFARSLSVP